MGTMIYTNQSSGKKKKNASKKLIEAKQKHMEFLQSIGYSSKFSNKYKVAFPDLSVESVTATSDNLYVSGGYKNSVDDYKWKRGREENKQTIDAIEIKKKSIVIPYNKGPTMLLLKTEDLTKIGKKV